MGIIGSSRRHFYRLFFVFSVILFLFGASAVSAQTVLSYSPWLPPSFPPERAVKEWLEQIEVVTEGRVKAVPRAASVGAPNAQFDVVRDGLVDISLVVPGYNPGRFPLVEMAELPAMSTDPAYSAPSYYRLYHEHFAPLKPFDGVHVLSTWLIQAQHVATRATPVTTIDGFKGLKLRSPNPQSTESMKVLGAIPVAAPGSELYQMAASGIVDGAFFNMEPMISFNIHPFFKSMTVVPGGMTSGSFVFVINEHKWNSLEQRDRDAISKIAGEALAAEVGKVVAEGERRAEKELKQQGVQFTYMTSEQAIELLEALKPVDEAWIAKAQKVGLEDPEQVLANFRAEQRTAID